MQLKTLLTKDVKFIELCHGESPWQILFLWLAGYLALFIAYASALVDQLDLVSGVGLALAFSAYRIVATSWTKISEEGLSSHVTADLVVACMSMVWVLYPFYFTNGIGILVMTFLMFILVQVAIKGWELERSRAGFVGFFASGGRNLLPMDFVIFTLAIYILTVVLVGNLVTAGVMMLVYVLVAQLIYFIQVTWPLTKFHHVEGKLNILINLSVILALLWGCYIYLLPVHFGMAVIGAGVAVMFSMLYLSERYQ